MLTRYRLSQEITVHTLKPQLSSVLILSSTSLNDVVSIVTTLRVGCSEESWLDSRREQKIYFCSKTFRLALEATQPPTQWLPGLFHRR